MDGIYKTHDEPALKCAEPDFDDYICLKADDFNKLVNSLINRPK